MANNTQELIKGFIEESAEGFSEIENDLIEIESNPENLDIINSIFRVMHTIKGTAGFLKLDEISKLSHVIESIFDMIRCERLKITPSMMDEILPAIDLLKKMVFELLKPAKSEYNLARTIDSLLEIAAIGQDPLNETQNESIKVDEKDLEDPSVDSSPTRDQDTANETIINQFNHSVVNLPQSTRKDFVIEIEEHLATIEVNLLNLEKNPDHSEAIDTIFRSIHSVKGTSDYVNLEIITNISHKLETIFDQIRKGKQKYTDDLADVTLKAVDIISRFNSSIKNDIACPVFSVVRTINQLDSLLSKSSIPTPQATAPLTADTLINAFRNISVQQMLIIHHLGENFISNTLEEKELPILHRSIRTLKNIANNVGARKVVNLTTKMEDLLIPLLTGEKPDPHHPMFFRKLEDQLREEITSLNKTDAETFAEITREQDIEETEPEEPVEEEAPEDTPTPEETETPSLQPEAEQSKTTRIDSERLDMFMNLIGELIIAKNSFSHTLSSLADGYIPTDLMQELKAVESSFNRISQNLQRNLMDIRLVPVKNVFQKIPRIVRDISRKTKKSIQLQMIGEDTEIDKYIVEMIGDPLIHIVRNCCDHGIEPPDVREDQGKPATGNIILKARQMRNNVLIEVIDDGVGLNTNKILELALERGLVSHEKAVTLQRKAIHNFIFAPGFSTAREITDISGRGVGMDVVNTNIKRINGSVDIESTEGQGTQVTLMLPLTLAVIDALLVVDNGQKYAVPLDAVKETVEVREEQIQILNQKEVIDLRGEVIGISRLSDLLELDRTYSDPDEVLSMVLLQSGNQVLGILVDNLFTQEEIVVKPLQRYLAKITGLSGSAILGNGEIILILDPLELINLAAQ